MIELEPGVLASLDVAVLATVWGASMILCALVGYRLGWQAGVHRLAEAEASIAAGQGWPPMPRPLPPPPKPPPWTDPAA